MGTDGVFTRGHKWFDDPNDWGWTSGKCSSKTDINNVLLHITTDAQGHIASSRHGQPAPADQAFR